MQNARHTVLWKLLPIWLLAMAGGPSHARPGEATPRLVSELPEKLARIERQREKLADQLKRARGRAEKDRVYLAARELVTGSITGDIFPAWMGTPWHMGEDDDASMPHQEGKRVSCSMFVTAVLQNAGLRLDDRVRWAHSRALTIQRSLAPRCEDLHRYLSISPRELAERLARLRAGLYLIGLNCHIGFVVIGAGEVRFVHSNYVDPERGVVDEPLATSRAIANSQQAGYWVTPLFQDERLVELWLSGEPVRLQKLGQLRDD
ncbi:MAG: hypothetical protein JXR96_09025 [Deltaproteobacteria bacterium]|nr:hypothetical protein [Deltaproteobacteria bacterium]